MTETPKDVQLGFQEILSAIKALDARLDALTSLVSDTRRLVGPFGAALPDGTMLVQSLHGIKYVVDPLEQIMTPQMIIYRQWEADLSAAMLSGVSPETVFVDVGANFGYFTCLLASRIGVAGTGHVMAFEPNPQVAALLRRNVTINWSMCPVDVREVALGSARGAARMVSPANRAANASLVSGGSPVDGAFTVELARLDDILPTGNRIDIMKIDVEGHELEVLRGASRCLRENPGIALYMEWSRQQFEEAGYSAEELLSFLESHGLAPYDITPGASTPLTAEYMRDLAYDNILFRRP